MIDDITPYMFHHNTALATLCLAILLQQNSTGFMARRSHAVKPHESQGSDDGHVKSLKANNYKVVSNTSTGNRLQISSRTSKQYGSPNLR